MNRNIDVIIDNFLPAILNSYAKNSEFEVDIITDNSLIDLKVFIEELHDTESILESYFEEKLIKFTQALDGNLTQSVDFQIYAKTWFNVLLCHIRKLAKKEIKLSDKDNSLSSELYPDEAFDYKYNNDFSVVKNNNYYKELFFS